MSTSRAARKAREKERRMKILTVAVIVLVILLQLILFMPRELVINVNGAENAQVEFGSEYKDPGAEAVYQMKLLHLFSKKVDVEAVNAVDTGVLGQQTLEYTASWKGETASASRTVTVEDTVSPKIRLLYSEDYYTLPGHVYEEEGFAAYDLCDGDLTESVVRTQSGDRVTYTVSDSSGNTCSAVRGILYDDRSAPEITLVGGDITIGIGDSWTDEFAAVDDGDGDLTADVVVKGSVNTEKAGKYTIVYTVSDSYGNQAVASRVVRVLSEDEMETDKTIYLTFDDGPGKYTERLLNILDKYDVKVTFFVTNQYPEYQDLITREAESGHTVAVHTYSHNYSKIYSGTEAYWSDFDQMNAIIKEKTGQGTVFFRFPGGSSNVVSKKYMTGIMTLLVQQANEKGYTYFDWNVTSGDGGDTTSSAVELSNIQSGVAKNRVSCVLCHDVKEFTIDTMETFIPWALDNGYHFRAIDENSTAPHHSVNN